MKRGRWSLLLAVSLMVGLSPQVGAQVITVDAADDFGALGAEANGIQDVTQILNLTTGYNLVSWDVDAYNDSIEVILRPIVGKVLQVQAFEATAALNPNPNANIGLGARIWVPGAGGFNNLIRTDRRLGYWIKMSAPGVLEVGGDSVMAITTQIPLAPGFNLIAYAPTRRDSTANAVEYLGSMVRQVQGFETALNNPNPTQKGAKIWTPFGGRFNTLKVMGPHLGYWVNMTTTGSLQYPFLRDYPADPASKAMVSAGPDDEHVLPTSQWIGIYGELRTGDGAPAPAGTVVDVVDGAGNVAGWFQVHNPGEYGYLPVYLDDPSTPVDEGADVGEQLTVRVNGVATATKVRWTQFGDLAQVTVTAGETGSASGAPTTFALRPNQPNPFNPATTISYDLPGAQLVSLSIYNSAGQVVRQLVNKVQPAGSYDIVWDGRDEEQAAVASGVYFSRFRAGDFEQTRSMLLLK